MSERCPDWARPVASEKVVVLAASAGGLAALGDVLAGLPSDFPAAVVIVQHRGEDHAELLPSLLARRTTLTVRHARDGEPLEAGTVYVCPPGMHMAAERAVRLVPGPRLDHVRPSADLMLRSVASVYGEHAIGVVLSGRGSDGALGSIAVVAAGGTIIAQDPASSAFGSMPTATIERGRADLVVPAARIGVVLQQLLLGGDGARTNAAVEQPIRVLIADDHRMILDGLRVLLERERDIVVVGEAEDGRAAVRLAGRLEPDVVVIDIAMPRLNGIDATRRIKTRSPRTNIVALSARVDTSSGAALARAGALGYLSKDVAFGELARAIRTVASGVPYVSESVAAIIGPGFTSGNADAGLDRLSAMERQVVQLMAEGESAARIATTLGLDLAIVLEHEHRVMEKLQIDNVVGLTRWAIREGITSLDF